MTGKKYIQIATHFIDGGLLSYGAATGYPTSEMNLVIGDGSGTGPGGTGSMTIDWVEITTLDE